MATTSETPTLSSQPKGSISISTTSHDTALCLVPPKHLWPSADRLRSLYDKAYLKWPPHVNLIYPFVRPEHLPSASQRIREFLSNEEPLRISLDTTGVFPHKHDNTIYRHDSSTETASRLKAIRTGILSALGSTSSGGRPFQMHMTIAQTEDATADIHRFLVDKVDLLPVVEWEADTLFLLVRERVQLDGTATSQMKIWGTISLSSGQANLARPERPLPFYSESQTTHRNDEEEISKDQQLTFVFDDETASWLPFSSSEEEEPPQTLTISTYNLLAEFTHPPSPARYPLLLSTLTNPTATSSLLLLQEVTDSFLSYLLSDPKIRDLYPYTSHGPPSQSDIDPLPSHLNTVLLSQFPFSWEYIPLTRKHKSALVATFPTLGPDSKPLVFAGVHLTCGLTDGSISAKKADIQRVVRYLAENHAGSAWVLAGDFNISTSNYTINAAVEKGAVSKESVAHMEGAETLLEEAGLQDAWKTTREMEFGVGTEEDEDLPGEEGATYDPTINEVAAEIVGSGYGMRPQRYDRIYVKGGEEWSVSGFNMFGKEKGRVGEGESYASDHWGVRCELEAGSEKGGLSISDEISGLVVPVEMTESQEGMGGVEEALAEMGVFPTEEDAARRKEAVQLLKRVLLDGSPAETSRVKPTVVVVPVGSYALGVWTSASDIDVLCIGPFSTTTFFALATQRLRKAAAQDLDVRILRRVKANTGTMLELEVLGIKMDLQYCPATAIAEQYPQVLRAPPTSPVWSLSVPTLSKLKALRDVDYLLRSLHTSLPTFRLSHRFIKTWARSRGIYSARFGFLGSIQISLLLARVIKLLLPGPVPLPTLLTTFFTHYAKFPWATRMAFDPLFHASRLPYARTSREPLAILGYFPPALNTCAAASVPSTRAIAAEFTLAASQITSGASWVHLLCPSGADAFLSAFPTYIRIDVQYWGVSPSRGRRFIGWLESRFVMLLVDVHRRAQGLHARMWPARFVVSDTTTESTKDEEEGKDYRGCYLIGLEKMDAGMSRDETKAALGGLRSSLSRFEEMMRSDEKYFDARSCWLAGEIVNRSNLSSDKLDVDAREWGEYTAGDDEEDDDEDEEEDNDMATGMEDVDLSDAAQEKKKSKKQMRREKEEKKPAGGDVYKLETGKKFRTAADVMSRIRWDPEMESGDFVVGYEDRFVGAREKALDAWKSEQTDEEFIPQHRILYFKRKSDGEVLWERRTRKDVIFGSGL